MSACAATPRQVRRPRVTDRHRRVAVQQQQRHRLADDVAAADDDGVARRRSGCPIARAARSRPTACTAPGRARPCTSRPTLTGCEAVDVLVGIDRVEHALRRRRGPSPPAAATARGCRRARRCVQPIDQRRAARRAIAVAGSRCEIGPQPGLAAGLQLVADVDLRRRVVADQHDAEPRRPARRAR